MCEFNMYVYITPRVGMSPPLQKKLAEVINSNVRFWRQFGRFICFKALVFHLTKSQVLNRRD